MELCAGTGLRTDLWGGLPAIWRKHSSIWKGRLWNSLRGVEAVKKAKAGGDRGGNGRGGGYGCGALGAIDPARKQGRLLPTHSRKIAGMDGAPEQYSVAGSIRLGGAKSNAASVCAPNIALDGHHRIDFIFETGEQTLKQL